MRKFLTGRAAKSKTFRRVAIGIVALVPSVGVALIGAAPAQAVTTPHFWIYYSQNCSGAARYYSGANSGENWINDVFNIGTSATPGYGEKIAYNAASVWVGADTWLQIDYDNTYQSFFIQKSSTGGCVNLSPATRNQNYDWADGN